MASCLFLNQTQWTINMREAVNNKGVIFYPIFISVGGQWWIVRRRYREFAKLHDCLVKEQGISSDLLPPKTFLRNLHPAFIEKRRSQLEIYLNNVVQHLIKTLPWELVTFLELETHDIMFIVKNIPNCPASLDPNNAVMDLLQVHSLSERLRLPCPAVEYLGYHHDLCHILELVARIFCLRIEKESVFHMANKPATVDFVAFKSLRNLTLFQISPNLINADQLRNNLQSLTWSSGTISTVEDAFLCDSLHKQVRDDTRRWSQLTTANLSHCNITAIGDAIKLAPNLVTLILNHNRIESLSGLNQLKNLQVLEVRNNEITDFESLNAGCGFSSLTSISLANNKLKSLKGIETLKILKTIDVSNNQISNFCELVYLRLFPILTSIIMSENPISSEFDYRVKVLDLMGNRANVVCLDKKCASQDELDRICVLRALTIVREGINPL